MKKLIEKDIHKLFNTYLEKYQSFGISGVSRSSNIGNNTSNTSSQLSRRNKGITASNIKSNNIVLDPGNFNINLNVDTKDIKNDLSVDYLNKFNIMSNEDDFDLIRFVKNVSSIEKSANKELQKSVDRFKKEINNIVIKSQNKVLGK